MYPFRQKKKENKITLFDTQGDNVHSTILSVYKNYNSQVISVFLKK